MAVKTVTAGRGKQLRFWMLAVIVPTLGFALATWAKSSQWAAEYLFARGITRVLTTPLTFVMNLFPFSVAEILLYGLLLSIPVGLILCCIRPKVEKWKRFGGWILCLFFWGFFLFQTLFVVQFGRESLDSMLSYDTADITAQELYDTALPLLKEANALCDSVWYTDAGDSRYQAGQTMLESNRMLLRHTYNGFSEMEDTTGVPLGWISARPKPVLFSLGLAYTGITGIYIPFTGESNVNIMNPSFEIPMTAAHELAHQKGFSREDEANYIALWVCMRDEDPYVRYSGYTCAFRYVANSLYRADKELYRELMAQLDPRIQKEFAYYNGWWKQFEGKAEEVSTQINNTYLQASGSPGVISYGLVTRLLVGEYRSRLEP